MKRNILIGLLAQIAVRILLYADNQQELIKRMEQIKNTIKAFDENGNDLLIKEYSYKELI